MFRNYLKIAWRNLLRHKTFSVINIGGLAIGIAACLLISLYVHYEWSYDAYHTKGNRIVRITNLMRTPEKDNVNIALSPTLLAATLKHDYPDVEAITRFEPGKAIIKVGNQLYNEDNVLGTDVEIFKVFNYPLTEGDPSHALADRQGIVLSARLAKKYFGNQKALGKNISYNKKPYHVTGVMAELPENSDLKIDALVNGNFEKETAWMDADFAVYTFVLFKQKPDLDILKKKLAIISKRDLQPELNKTGAVGYSVQFDAEMLKDVHFSTDKMGDTPKGDKLLVYIFSVLAMLILLIALLNYINLSTARATERAKEVGVRKVNGALQSSLVRQFLFESLFVTMIALLIGIGLMFLMLPLLNNLLQIRISFLSSAFSFITVCGLVLASSLLTGLYPAFVLSAFNPIAVLKGNFKFQAKGISLRKGITIVQFVIATVMIAGAFIMNQQINFVQHRSIGYDKDQLLNVGLPDDSAALTRVGAFSNALKQLSQVKGLTAQTGLSMLNNQTPKSTTTVMVNGVKREIVANYFSVDEHFIPLLHMQLIAGHNFYGNEKVKKAGYIVNEAFLKQVGLKDPIGKNANGFDDKSKIIGVVKNFHYASMHNPIAPLVLVYQSMKPTSVLVKINPHDANLVHKTWQTYFPDVPYSADFMDDGFNAMYQKDRTTIRLFNFFTLLSILLASLGLYGLANLIAVQRTKEIGIRKVLGAALDQLLVLLAKDFVKLVAIAAVLAIPITWLVMNKWLAFYAYHIDISWWLLALPVVIIIAISITVISYQTVKVAVSNPVNSLKNDR
ncbi:ABC transporter permease [Mucilaginibacter mali]|uniref:ABC transporter permease n=1 Tax=Mucilaginibacter mali TaxID=2740462 RepID=A0A7D4TP05_9SPHI|nr:ABC transporter permease [Mucilaginibacter mali]QKJ30374.1 ABC transporter permease [Mucilaginibacter mali]